MSPLIITTGERERPLELTLLPGEPIEAMRAAVCHAVWCVKFDLVEEEVTNETMNFFAKKLGMPEEINRKIIASALNSTPGVKVRFKTVFLEKGRIGGEREYTDFSLEE